VATVGVVLAALYLLWAYQRVFHGEPDEANSSFKELNAKEGMLMAVFVAIILFTGIYPKPMLERIEPSVSARDRAQELLQRYGALSSAAGESGAGRRED
jgi:NADH:ubiquinone oxidoreductase subunit 4 (subunit M)